MAVLLPTNLGIYIKIETSVLKIVLSKEIIISEQHVSIKKQ
jgi:hypothetical protein